MPSAQAVPVEALLKLVLDKSGADEVRRFMDEHDRAWSNIESKIGRIGNVVEGMGRSVLGLAGIAGVGAIAQQFMSTGQFGSNTALAAGMVTGGPGVWHPYQQALLSAQRRTGVGAGDISQGLIMAVQSVGGAPTPQQASVLGGLLAGYGQTVGMTPAQVAQVLSPMLQAANRPLTQGTLAGSLGLAQQGLTAFPGSQASPILGLLASLGLSQALGGGGPQTAGNAAIINAAAQANHIFRNPQVLGSAITGIGGGLQGAFSNPSMEAFLNMAGISYADQRKGFTSGNVQRIMAEATRLYGTGPARDMALRSMFGGIPGADFLEQFQPGSKAQQNAVRQAQALQNMSPGQLLQHLLGQTGNAQAATTPNALLNRGTGGVLGWLFSSPLHAALGIGGLLFGPKLLGKGLSGAGGALSKLLGGGGAEVGAGAEELGGATIGDFLGGASRFMGVGGAIGALASALAFPDTAGANDPANMLVRRSLQAAQQRFGHGARMTDPKVQQYMLSNLLHGPLTTEGAPDQVQKAAQMLRQAFSQAAQPAGGGKDLFSTIGDIDKTLQQMLSKMNGPSHPAALTGPGPGGQFVSYLGASAQQAFNAGAPGVEFAALTGLLSGAGGIPASLSGAPSAVAASLSTPVGGGGWQACTLTWYDPALGGTNSSNGAANPHAGMADGQPYSPTAMTCAAPSNYPFGTQIAFSYRGKQVVCTVTDRGGAIQGSHFDLARGPATALGIIGPGVVSAQFKVLSTGSGSAPKSAPSSSGSSGVFAATRRAASPAGGAAGGGATVAHPSAVGGAGGGGGGQPIHVHVYVDGHKQRTHRVKIGHHR